MNDKRYFPGMTYIVLKVYFCNKFLDVTFMQNKNLHGSIITCIVMCTEEEYQCNTYMILYVC